MDSSTEVTEEPNNVRDAIDALSLAAADARARLKRAANSTQLTEAWTVLTNTTLDQLFYSLAMRGQTTERLKMYCLYVLPDHVLINDKDVGDDLKYRLLPKTSITKRALNAYADGLTELSHAVARLRIKVRALPTLHSFRAHTPAFFRLRVRPNSSSRLDVQQVERPALVQSFNQYFGCEALNSGRHDLVTELLVRGEDRHLPRVLTGHATRGAEVSGDASLLPPRLAIEALAEALERITRDRGIQIPWEPAKYSPRIVGQVPTSNDPYIVQRIDEHYRILPPAVDQYTPVALAVAAHVRQMLLAGRGPDDPWARLAVSLACYNALGLSDVKLIVGDSKPTVLAAPAPLLVWTRPAALELAIPMNPVPALILCATRRTPATSPWPRILREIDGWARHALPDLSWQSDAPNAAVSLFALLARYVRFVCPPAALAAASDAVAAAVYNRESQVRIRDHSRAPADACSVPGTKARPHAPRYTRDALQSVAKVAHTYGSEDKALGGDVKRARGARPALDALSVEHHGPAAALRDWLLRECHILEDKLKDPVQWSSLSTYVSETVIGLRKLSPFDDPRSWDGSEWFEFVTRTVEEIREEHRERGDPRYSGLKRFLKAGAALGWDIQPALYADNDAPVDLFRVSAASTVLLERDIERIWQYVSVAFDDEPLLAPAAVLATSMFEELGQRSAEVLKQTCDCVERSTNSVITKEGPHSHIKSLNGWRTVPATSKLIADLDWYVTNCRSESNFLFLDDGGNDSRIANEIHEVLTQAIRHTTGSPVARVHSFRAAAATARLYPRWQSIAGRILNGDATPKECERWIGELAASGFCALGESIQRMGLGSVKMLIVYYMPVWPFVLSATMLASLAAQEPSAALIEAAFGSTAAYRKHKSRSGEDFDPWPYLLRKAAGTLALPPLVTAEPASVLPSVRPAVRPQVPPRRAIAKFIQRILAGGRTYVPEAAHRHMLGNSFAAIAMQRLDEQSPTLRQAARRLGAMGERGQSAILRSVDSKESEQQLDALLNASAEEVEALLTDLCSAELGAEAPTTEQIIGRLAQHTQCIPPQLVLMLRPTHAITDPAIGMQLVQLGRRACLGAPVHSRRPSLFVYPINMQGNLVRMGRTTDLLRISALAVHVANQLSQP